MQQDVEIEYFKIRLPPSFLADEGISGVQQLIGSVGGERLCLPLASQSSAPQTTDVPQKYFLPPEPPCFLSPAPSPVHSTPEDAYTWNSQEHDYTYEPASSPLLPKDNLKLRFPRSFWQLSSIGLIVGLAVTAVIFRSALVEFSVGFKNPPKSAPPTAPVSTDNAEPDKPPEETKSVEHAEQNTLIELLQPKKQ